MAGYIFYNPNPYGSKVGDCVIRAISAVTDQDWDTTYAGIAFQGFALKDMPSSNYVWGEYLRAKGFEKEYLPTDCPACYTVAEFADAHPDGKYVLCTGTHAVALIQGDIWDNWDSRGSIVDYVFKKKEDKG